MMNAPHSQLATDAQVAFDEATAAQMLGLEERVLRTERLRGRIGASKIVGGRIRYSRSDLDGYLAAHRFTPRA